MDMQQIDIEKKFPHSVETEQIIIATCCGRDRSECLPLLPVNVLDMFYRNEYRELMSVVLELYRGGVEPDLLSVCDRLAENDERMRKCGGLETVTYVISNCWNAGVNFEFHLAKFISLYKRRELITQCEIAISKARDLEENDADQYLLEQIDCINRNSAQAEIPDSKDLSLDYLDGLLAGKTEKRIFLGVDILDKAFNGVSLGTLSIVGGRTGMGKTAVSFTFARNMYLAGHNVLYFNLEMQSDDLLGRLYASVTDIPYKAFSDGRITANSHETIFSAYSHLHSNRDNHLYICSECDLTVDDICRKATIQHLKYGIDVIFVDYLGRLSIPEIAKNSHFAIGEVVRKLKNLAMKLNVAVFLLVQGNRECEGASDKRMSIANLAGSDIIGHEADNIFLLYRESYYTQEKSDVLEINHVKARKSQPRTFRTFFSLEHMRFYNAPLDGELQDKKSVKEAKELFNS